MPVANAGEVHPWQLGEDDVGEDISFVAFNYDFINECPLVARIGQRRAGAQEFRSLGSLKRPEQVQIITAVDNVAVTLACADASYLLNGDILENRFADNTVEMIEIATDPNLTTHTIQVIRGDAGTVPGAIPANAILRLVGNSRTGGETMQRAIAPTTWRRSNWVQNLQHPVEVSGLLNDTDEFRAGIIASGTVAPLDAYRMRGLWDTMQDMGRIGYYSRGMAPTDSDTNRAKTRGVREQCEIAGTLIRQAPNFSAFSPDDFLFTLNEGGTSGTQSDADVIFIDKSFIAILAKWKMGLVAMDMDETELNVNIRTYTSPIVDAVFVVDPLLRRGSYFACKAENILLRWMRLPTWYNLAKLGDHWKGEVIARIGLQLDYPEKARFVEGITNGAAA